MNRKKANNKKSFARELARLFSFYVKASLTGGGLEGYHDFICGALERKIISMD